MATGARAGARRGQLAKKSLRGLTRRCRRQSARRDPRPPWCRISCVKMPFYSRKPTPFDLCCIALLPTCCASTACKGRPSVRCRDGRFACRRASIDGPTGLPARAAGLPQARAVIVYNPRAVTNSNPYYRTRVLLPLSALPHARTAHAPAIASPVHPPSCAHSRQVRHFSLLVASFLLRTYAIAPSFALVSQP